MPNIRKTFINSVMNLDVDERLLKDGEYRKAVNIEISHSEGSDVEAAEKPLSNKKLTNINFGANPITLGEYSDEFRDKIYWFVLSDIGAYLMEYDYTNNVTSFVLKDTRPLETRVLNLKNDKFITGIAKIISETVDGDLLLFTDDNIEPICLNVERAKTYVENGFEREDIYLIKKPPRFAPTTQLTYVSSGENNLKENFFTFGTRFKYLDGEYSAISSFTKFQFSPSNFKLDYQTMENLGMINQFNAIRIEFYTGGKQVTDVQLVYKKSNSNIIYRIETFNKKDKGWNDNEVRYHTFSNDKRYIALPEKELFRSYDNVPNKAKSLAIIQNYPVMGDYTEGFNLIDKDGNKVVLDYVLSLLNNNLSGGELITTLSQTTIANDTITFNIGTNELKKDTKLVFYIDLTEGTDGKYQKTFEFILNEDYVDMNALAAAPDFILFISTVLLNDFTSSYTVTAPANLISTTISPYTILASTASTISISAPTITYVIDDTPADTTDNAESTQIKNWYFNNVSLVYFKEFAVSTSLKTNRSYEIGFIYLDDFGRKTTTLVNEFNTIFIPQKFATHQNKIYVEIRHNPPKFADRYKLVIKQNKGNYHTIYSSIYYKDGLFIWVKLNGDESDKVNKGDTLIVKSDARGFVADLEEVKVLEKVNQNADFIQGNQTPANIDIIELSGSYIKIKPNGMILDSSSGVVSQYGFGADHEQDRIHAYLYFRKDYKIKNGATVIINIQSWEKDKSDHYWGFQKTIISSREYANFQAFFWAEVMTIGSFVTFEAEHITFDFGNTPISVDLDRLAIHSREGGYGSGIINGTGQRKLEASVHILNSELLIFETKPKDAELDLFYETEQTFEIINGYHKGNKQNQDVANNAIVEMDYFNCYVQGNGVESYRIKDGFNTNYLNIDLRPSTVSLEEYREVKRYGDLIHGQSFIESLGINGLNEFNPSVVNFKELDKQYGSIQKIVSRDTDLVIFQEDKAGYVLFKKRSMRNADGTHNVVTADAILGDYISYVGENGIARNPESVAIYRNNIFYTNSKRGTPMRLGRNGTSEINYKTIDHFRDLFIKNTKGKKIGGIDPYTNKYFLTGGNETISYSEKVKGWTSFWEFEPDWYSKLNNRFFALKNGQLYLHHVKDNGYNNFFGVQLKSEITQIFNQEHHLDKIFKTFIIDGFKAWDISVKTNLGVYSTITKSEFTHKESRWFAYIRKNEDATNLNGLVQGIGNITEINASKIKFNNIPKNVSVGDELYNQAEQLIGKIDDIKDNVITINTIVTTPVLNIFCYSKKPVRISGVEIRGRYMEVTLTDGDNTFNELFAIGSNVVKSFI